MTMKFTLELLLKHTKLWLKVSPYHDHTKKLKTKSNTKGVFLYGNLWEVSFLVEVSQNSGPTGRQLHDKIEIALGTIPSWFPVAYVILPGCF